MTSSAEPPPGMRVVLDVLAIDEEQDLLAAVPFEAVGHARRCGPADGRPFRVAGISTVRGR